MTHDAKPKEKKKRAQELSLEVKCSGEMTDEEVDQLAQMLFDLWRRDYENRKPAELMANK